MEFRHRGALKTFQQLAARPARNRAEDVMDGRHTYTYVEQTHEGVLRALTDAEMGVHTGAFLCPRRGAPADAGAGARSQYRRSPADVKVAIRSTTARSLHRRRCGDARSCSRRARQVLRERRRMVAWARETTCTNLGDRVQRPPGLHFAAGGTGSARDRRPAGRLGAPPEVACGAPPVGSGRAATTNGGTIQ